MTQLNVGPDVASAVYRAWAMRCTARSVSASPMGRPAIG